VGDYLPIDCSLHDRIEDIATGRRTVALRYEDDAGSHDTQDAIVDWVTHDGAEYLRTAAGLSIRLDRILEIDGVRYR
jgi:Rho-binding antiterminator